MAGRNVPDDEHRCTRVRVNGKRCRQPRSEDGSTLCTWHVQQQVALAERLRLAEDVPDVPIETHLQLELRISWTMVRVAELQMQDLGLDVDAFVTDTKETETRDGGPGGGYVSVKRARVMGAHPLIITYLREREQHMKVIQMCIAAGLAARQIAAVEKFVDATLSFATMLAEALGHDPADSATRATILSTLRQMEEEMQEPSTKVIEG